MTQGLETRDGPRLDQYTVRPMNLPVLFGRGRVSTGWTSDPVTGGFKKTSTRESLFFLTTHAWAVYSYKNISNGTFCVSVIYFFPKLLFIYP